MTSLAKAVLPRTIIDVIRRRRQQQWLRLRRRMTNEEIFSDIYSANRWGGVKGEFCSGSGSTHEATVAAYVEMIRRLAVEHGFSGTRFVDLGCGDFRVGQRLLPLCSSYVGVDVVPALVERNNRLYGSQTTRFLAQDLTRDDPPEGDVCFVRQVLQHLSNAEISAILPKLGRYRWVFITEHQPHDLGFKAPNIDKVHGADVRVVFGSGVYVDQPPFNLPGTSLDVVLELPGTALGSQAEAGVIRTILYEPRRNGRDGDPIRRR